MILEQAMLHIKPGEEAVFETAFRRAAPIVAGMPGCRSVDLLRCLERPASYLLLVRWDRLEDHTEGFRRSPRYREWAALLHHFYDPFPVVDHFAPIALGPTTPHLEGADAGRDHP